MAAKKQNAVIRPTCDVVEINGYLVGRTSPKSRIFLVWEIEANTVVAKFGKGKSEGESCILFWTEGFDGNIDNEVLADVANAYYAEADERRKAKAKANKKPSAKSAPSFTVRLPKADAQTEMSIQ